MHLYKKRRCLGSNLNSAVENLFSLISFLFLGAGNQISQNYHKLGQDNEKYGGVQKQGFSVEVCFCDSAGDKQKQHKGGENRGQNLISLHNAAGLCNKEQSSST